MEMLNFMQTLNEIYQTSQYKENRKNSFPMENIINFLKKSLAPENWIKLESYMQVNGKKINDTFPENKKLYNNDTLFYKLGLLFEKKDNKIFFTSYTISNGICVHNHKSIHKINGDLMSGTLNSFGIPYRMGYNIKDVKTYLDTIIDELEEDIISKKFKWDVIKI
jgi:hypothetical protein